MRPLKRLVAIAIAGVAILAVGEALAADATVSSAALCCTYAPARPAPKIPAGGTLSFRNATAGVPHSVTADDGGPDGKALFGSPLVTGTAAGTIRTVAGVQYLAPGTYQFHCSVHPTTMTGTLTVTSGTPVARPQIDVAIAKQTLNAVRRTGELKVQVDAKTQSKGVSLVASKGAKAIARDSGIAVAAGASKSVSMQLTNAGKKALEGSNQARITLRGTVPFGAPATATRVLRSS
jgi:plastocyanin